MSSDDFQNIGSSYGPEIFDQLAKIVELWPKLSWSVQTLTYHLVIAYSQEENGGEVDLGSLDDGGLDVKSKEAKPEGTVLDFQQLRGSSGVFSDQALTPADGVQDEAVKGGIPESSSEEVVR